MPTHRKTQLMDRVHTLLAAVSTTPALREVARRQDLLLLADKLPCLHYFAGDEQVTEQGEDNRGYTIQFPLCLKLVTADYRDLAEKLEAIEAAVQTTFEADPTLNGLANWVRYQGSEEFLQKQNEPSGGKLLRYLVEYRRLKADPTSGY